MRRLVWIAVVCVVILVAIVGGFRWFESSLAAGRRKAIADSLSDFHQHQSQYAALIPKWRSVYKSSNECGLPVPTPGMVQFRSFAMKDDGSYRATVHGNEEVFSSIQQAANALNVEPENIQSLVAGLRSAGRSVIYQHDAEVRIPSGAYYGVLFVSPSCPQANGYEAEGKPGPFNHFVNLITLGGGWYYYAERN